VDLLPVDLLPVDLLPVDLLPVDLLRWTCSRWTCSWPRTRSRPRTRSGESPCARGGGPQPVRTCTRVLNAHFSAPLAKRYGFWTGAGALARTCAASLVVQSLAPFDTMKKEIKAAETSADARGVSPPSLNGYSAIDWKQTTGINDRIFVQIASYRDPECQWTLKIC